jgi:hypothetical protein
MSTPEHPEPTPDEEEQQADPQRRREEDAQRGAGHEDPDGAREPSE